MSSKQKSPKGLEGSNLNQGVCEKLTVQQARRKSLITAITMLEGWIGFLFHQNKELHFLKFSLFTDVLHCHLNVSKHWKDEFQKHTRRACYIQRLIEKLHLDFGSPCVTCTLHTSRYPIVHLWTFADTVELMNTPSSFQTVPRSPSRRWSLTRAPQTGARWTMRKWSGHSCCASPAIRPAAPFYSRGSECWRIGPAVYTMEGKHS